MAIAHDNADGDNTAAATSITVSFVTTGADLAVVCGVIDDSGTGDRLTTVTYDGNNSSPTTGVDQSNMQGSYGEPHIVYQGDSATTANVVASASSSINFELCISSYTGVGQTQTDPQDTAVFETKDPGTSIDPTVTVATNNSWYIMWARNAAAAFTGGTATSRAVGAASNEDLADGAQAESAGAVTYTLTRAESNMSAFGFAIAPVIVAHATVKTWDTAAIATVKTSNTAAIANVKTVNTAP